MVAPLPRAERVFSALPAALWRSRGDLRYGFDVLRHGVCDGCSLGSHGLRDEVQGGIHLCRHRLDDLQRWTRSSLRLERLPDLAGLRRLGEDELRSLGRVSVPLLRRAGEDRFTGLLWDDAEKLLANQLDAVRERWSLLVDRRSNTNEGYFALRRLADQLEARHASLVAPPGYGSMQRALRRSLGVAASTCSLGDLLATDLVVVWGGGLQRQPLLGSWLRRARAAGVRVVLVGEPGSGEEFWEESFPIGSQGAFELICGALKGCSEAGTLEDGFVGRRVRDGSGWTERLAQWQWPQLEQAAGSSRELMQRLARVLGEASSAVFVVDETLAGEVGAGDSCTALLSLLLGRGFVGREGCGILVLGGGVGGQGAHDCGFEVCSPSGLELCADDLLLYGVGTALLEQGEAAEDVLPRVPVRVHQAHYLDPSMLLDAGELTLILPMQSRYEQHGGGIATSIDRWIRFSPEVRGHPIGDARPDWQIPAAIVARMEQSLTEPWLLQDSASVREAMDAAVPRYSGVVELHAPGHRMQWGGSILHREGFATEDGLAQLPLYDLR